MIFDDGCSSSPALTVAVAMVVVIMMGGVTAQMIISGRNDDDEEENNHDNDKLGVDNPSDFYVILSLASAAQIKNKPLLFKLFKSNKLVNPQYCCIHFGLSLKTGLPASSSL